MTTVGLSRNMPQINKNTHVNTDCRVKAGKEQHINGTVASPAKTHASAIPENLQRETAPVAQIRSIETTKEKNGSISME